MSSADELSGPHAAYLEEVHEESQDAIPGTKQTANIARKRSQPDLMHRRRLFHRRDAASDSGYSSQTVTTGDSLSSGPILDEHKSRSAPRPSALARITRKVTGAGHRKSPTKDVEQQQQHHHSQHHVVSFPPSPPTSPTTSSPRASSLHRTMSRSHGRDDLRAEAIGDERFVERRPRHRGSDETVDSTIRRKPLPPANMPPAPPHVTAAPPPAPTTAYMTAPPASLPAFPRQQLAMPPPPPPQPLPPQAGPPMVLSRTLSGPSMPMRPASYHAGIMPTPHSYGPPLMYYERRQQPPTLHLQTHFAHPPALPGNVPFSAGPSPISPTHPVPYAFPPPIFETPFHPAPLHPWQPYPMAPPQLYALRPGPPPGSHIVEYPMVPAGYHMRHARHMSEQAGPRPYLHGPDRGMLIPEEAALEDDEAYYRRAMPPPPPISARPSMRHAATFAAAPPLTRSESLDGYGPRSAAYAASGGRVGASKAASASAGTPTPSAEAYADPPSSAVRRRPVARPISYHGGRDLEHDINYYPADDSPSNSYSEVTPHTVSRRRTVSRGHRMARGSSDGRSHSSSGRESDIPRRRGGETQGQPNAVAAERQASTGSSSGGSTVASSSDGISLKLPAGLTSTIRVQQQGGRHAEHPLDISVASRQSSVTAPISAPVAGSASVPSSTRSNSRVRQRERTTAIDEPRRPVERRYTFSSRDLGILRRDSHSDREYDRERQHHESNSSSRRHGHHRRTSSRRRETSLRRDERRTTRESSPAPRRHGHGRSRSVLAAAAAAAGIRTGEPMERRSRQADQDRQDRHERQGLANGSNTHEKLKQSRVAIPESRSRRLSRTLLGGGYRHSTAVDGGLF